MIKRYEPYMGNTVHTIRITLMCFDYVGHIAFEVSGNFQGATLLNPEPIFDCQDIINEYGKKDCVFANEYVENDCEFTVVVTDENEDLYIAVLTNANGDKLEIVNTRDLIKEMIVSIEFVKVMRNKGEN